jgi:hypothetical protein
MLKNLLAHLKTVNTHRKFVMLLCFKLGIIKRGLLHDLSKYSPTELSIAKYYTGKNSPHQNCREQLGYSPSWMHHYHNNKHHYQYWQDQDEMDNNILLKMPYDYVIEMFCDRVGACKAYKKSDYTPEDTLKYYEAKTKGHNVLHFDTEILLEFLLQKIAEFDTEKEFCTWYKRNVKQLKFLYNSGYIYKIKE